MNALKNSTAHKAGSSQGGEVLPDFLSDVLEPSLRYTVNSLDSRSRNRADGQPCDHSRSGLSELRAPRMSCRIGLSEFLD